MGLQKSITRLEYLDYLISRKGTGTPKELADKLQISERWLYELINELKYDLHCPIKYSRRHQSYVYTTPGSLVIEFMEEKEQEKQAGTPVF